MRLADSLVADPLVGLAWDGRPVDRVVRDWKWDGPTTLRLYLRSDLKFHDGTPVDRAYFLKTIQAAFKDKQGAVSYGSVTEVTADDSEADVVRIKLSRPEAFLITDLAGSSLKHPTNPRLGTGPFKYDGEPGNTIKLRAFGDYYRGRPTLDELDIHNFGEARASWAALMRNEIDAVHEIASNALDFIKADGQTALRPYTFVRPYYVQLAFNTRHPLLKNAIVRQALSYGVDRTVIVDQAMNKQGMIAEGPIWPYHWAYSTAQKVYVHNTEAATLRLESAGFKVKPSTTGRMPSRLHIRCLIPEKMQMFEKAAIVLQKQLYEIGVDLEIQSMPGEDVAKRLESGEFETVLIQRTTGRSLAWTYLTYHSSRNSSGYRAADAVLERLRETTGETETRAAVADLQQIFHDDPPAIFIAWPQATRVLSSRFRVPDEKSTRAPGSRQAPDQTGRDVLSSIWLWKPTDAAK
jgi:peptide/nickel transport system substrate-binding protein